ncbi:hypothetical protein HYH02_013142 [Chlamydomonas schloesseri]|uniref:Uncharacterized protein n=1 Tax=Chlamydomonas schloesseri TaxID=2026947 RepID=A0A835VZS6_9CHLO|nr:hypothetical protein HYH02_013142 [Chlamydomonas schloesseri]|eukprot:KAG2431923.1 hypothetical protein HYH02_013142 [Chlamydomonas schloesseri]
MLPAHVLNWASSPQRRGVRLAWPQAEVPHSPTIAGVPRQHATPRFRGLPQPPSPTRLVPGANQPGPNPLRERDVATPASSYSSRPNAADSRREDEEHGATQLILLLTLSVVLLTLPWVVDHPVTLLVPVALLILPITSGALRSMLSEGASLLFGGMRWFWRHRKSAPPPQQQQQSHNGAAFGGLPGMHPNAAQHGHGPQGSGMQGWGQHAGNPAAFGAPHHHHGPAPQHHAPHPHQSLPHPHPQQQPHPAMRSADNHASAMRSVDLQGRPAAAPMPQSPGRQQPHQQQPWQAHAPHPPPHHQNKHAAPHLGQAWQQQPVGASMAPVAMPHVAAAAHASHSDLNTPDLDFESDLEADAGVQAAAAQAVSPRGVPARGAMPFPAHGPSAMPPQQPPMGQQLQQHVPTQHHAPAPQPAAYGVHAPHPPPVPQQPQQLRPRPPAGPVDPQAECHIRNWDEPECTARRGHRPLSELMNNGQ